MLPSRVSDAGPCIPGFPTFCPACLSAHFLDPGESLELWQCTADTCCLKMCRECREQCICCGLYFCNEHLTKIENFLVCAVCNEPVDDAEPTPEQEADFMRRIRAALAVVEDSMCVRSR